jgi:hypothetical protein
MDTGKVHRLHWLEIETTQGQTNNVNSGALVHGRIRNVASLKRYQVIWIGVCVERRCLPETIPEGRSQMMISQWPFFDVDSVAVRSWKKLEIVC